jgi:ABC-2 type transport system ATP-binding protein
MATSHQLRLADVDSSARPGESNYVIETERLDLWYGRKQALNQLSLRIPRGRIHAIVGANGAGKSSLFRILLGIQSPSSGRATILGHDCTALSERERARIGFVNEEHSLPTWLRVGELVSMQRRLYPQWDEQRYRNIVDHFQVLPDQRIASISRGERAGVNLAMGLAQNPELLILDEPTLGLDVVAKRAFLEAVLSSIDVDDMTIIYCSHQLDDRASG